MRGGRERGVSPERAERGEMMLDRGERFLDRRDRVRVEATPSAASGSQANARSGDAREERAPGFP
jgi:hypothetical protein